MDCNARLLVPATGLSSGWSSVASNVVWVAYVNALDKPTQPNKTISVLKSVFELSGIGVPHFLTVDIKRISNVVTWNRTVKADLSGATIIIVVIVVYVPVSPIRKKQHIQYNVHKKDTWTEKYALKYKRDDAAHDYLKCCVCYA